jgi:hypothetical protein
MDAQQRKVIIELLAVINTEIDELNKSATRDAVTRLMQLDREYRWLREKLGEVDPSVNVE